MLICVYDSETSGLPLFKEPSEDPRQPHICELAALVFDTDTGHLVHKYRDIVQQDGWEVDPEAFKAHGITKDRSMKEGKTEQTVLYNFLELHRKCDLRVAHNEQFDQRILRIALKRFGDEFSFPDDPQSSRDAVADKFKSKPAYCTMKNATPILNLPATEAMRASGRGSWKKSPSLAETYRHFFGEDFDGAHSALADAAACLRIYMQMTLSIDVGFLA